MRGAGGPELRSASMSIMGTRVVRVEDPAFLTRGATLHRGPPTSAGRRAAPHVRPVARRARPDHRRSTSRRPARRPGWSPCSPAPTSTCAPALLFAGRQQGDDADAAGHRRRSGSSASRSPSSSPRSPTRARTRPNWSRSTTTRCPRWSTSRPPPPTRCCCSPTAGTNTVHGFDHDKELDPHLFDGCEVVVTRDDRQPAGRRRPRWRPAPPPRRGATTGG